MNKNIKGLTIDIGGDTTKLGKALEDVDKQARNFATEIRQIEKLMKEDPTNSELIAQKQAVLGEAVEQTKKKLDLLKEAERQVQEQFERGDASAEQVRALQREIISTEAALKKYQDSANGAGEAVGGLGDNAGAAGKDMDHIADSAKKAGDGVADLGENADETEEDIEDVGEASEKAGKKIEGMGDIAKKAGAAAAAAMAAAAAASVELGKAVVDATAEQEQLIGGVETLFGAGGQTLEEYAASVGKATDEVAAEYETLIRSQEIVIDNANNAYKTAGLSANQYMETVTGFSASLLQSMGNDTEAAAAKADLALTDMSDNANKMGSDMSSIQTAYAGFAKQNYTMLDNLKIGYGGTKEEMERLLADAQKFSGIEYNIDSYADVIDAIHVIQTEMGITGTTAKEAATTISGSMAAASATVQNLLAGLGDENADVKALVDNVADAFDTVVDNIEPVLENLADALPDAVDAAMVQLERMLPELVRTAATLFEKVLDSIIKMLPELSQVASDAAVQLTKAILRMAPELIDSASEVLTTLINTITESLPELIPIAVEAVGTLAMALLDNIPLILDAALQLIMALAQGLIDALPQLIEMAPIIIEQLVSSLVSMTGELVSCALELIIALAGGLVEAIPELVKAVPDIIEAFVEGLKKGFNDIKSVGGGWIEDLWSGISDGINDFFRKVGDFADNVVLYIGLSLYQVRTAGRDFLTGLWDGIADKAQWVYDKITGLGDTVIQKVKELFQINSPSKVFEGIGGYLSLGLAEGIEEEADKPLRAMSDLTKDIIGEANGINGLDIEANVRRTAYTEAATYMTLDPKVMQQLDALLAAVRSGANIYLDGNKLVGGTIREIDAQLMNRAVTAKRGAI